MKRAFFSLVVFAAAAIGQEVRADSMSPACQGTAVDQALHGTYANEDVGQDFVLDASSLKYPDGTTFKAWSCLRNDILVLVIQLSDPLTGGDDYESHALAISGKHVINFGEISGESIGYGSVSGPVTSDTLAKIMAAGEAEIWIKK